VFQNMRLPGAPKTFPLYSKLYFFHLCSLQKLSAHLKNYSDEITTHVAHG